MRDIALRLFPLLVVVWATVAVLGGALYLAGHAAPPDAGHAAKAGLGLCAVSVAIFAGRQTIRKEGKVVFDGVLHRDYYEPLGDEHGNPISLQHVPVAPVDP